jgi:hypothetical protein
MTRFPYCKTLLAVAAMCAAVAAPAATLAKADYKAGKDTLSTTYKADLAACSAFTDNKRDICKEEAKAKDKVALAELEFAYTAKPADRIKVAVVKADTAYAVAKEKCDDLAGQPKDVCRAEAKAVHTKALVEAKLDKQVAAAVVNAADDRSDANYKLAREKCDSLAGTAQASCITDAKTRFNKT